MNHEKLSQLVVHLRSGKLQDKWNFNTFRETRHGEVCGCAVNCLAHLLSISELEYALDRHAGSHLGFDDIQMLVQSELEITKQEFRYFFLPRLDAADHNAWLTCHALPEEVADLIAHYQRTGDMLCRSEEELDQIVDGYSTDVSNRVEDYA